MLWHTFFMLTSLHGACNICNDNRRATITLTAEPSGKRATDSPFFSHVFAHPPRQPQYQTWNNTKSLHSNQSNTQQQMQCHQTGICKNLNYFEIKKFVFFNLFGRSTLIYLLCKWKLAECGLKKVTNGEMQLWLQDIFRKRVRFISCLRNRTLLNFRKGIFAWHWLCEMGKTSLALLRWLYATHSSHAVFGIYIEGVSCHLFFISQVSPVPSSREWACQAHTFLFVSFYHSEKLFKIKHCWASDATKRQHDYEENCIFIYAWHRLVCRQCAGARHFRKIEDCYRQSHKKQRK